MTLSFVTKQHEHLRSVRTLLAVGAHRDAFLVARTMAEGLGRLLWAFKDVPERTDLWLWFGAVLDWRRILKNEEAGMTVNPQEKDELKKLVTKHGPKYYRGDVGASIKAAQTTGKPYKIPKDPWRTNWTDATVKDMFDEVDLALLYEGMYRETSEWVHWGPRSVFMAMEPAEWGTRGFTQEDRPAAARALQLACFSLLTSLQVLDRHFSLGRTERLAGLERVMMDILSASFAAGA